MTFFVFFVRFTFKGYEGFVFILTSMTLFTLILLGGRLDRAKLTFSKHKWELLDFFLQRRWKDRHFLGVLFSGGVGVVVKHSLVQVFFCLFVHLLMQHLLSCLITFFPYQNITASFQKKKMRGRIILKKRGAPLKRKSLQHPLKRFDLKSLS